ncbi:conserved Plasmodium protein, unknown function [Plasmodium relictum]|uniref:PIH1 N-terminal domain-containing protein n=1 Tax=Plasmodium relictum TaxID=85471 RepID=A0A1J1H4P8_PLARL|nr:conserved Plasmodium protein, unknown function [Plasmodium relictum]CRG99531.1 conserved Plasmodium protein, unknown function [Plasmodium relictum]
MENIKISYEEKEKFHKAFRQHEFRILFDEYFDEISDIKYRKEKEDYLLSLYFKGELKKDQILIKPIEAFCVKTKILYANQTNQKLFLNICSHEGIENISFHNISNKSVNIPYSLSQIRPDKYGNNLSCLTIDCCVNPSTVDIIRRYNELLNFLLEDICLNIERNIMKDKEKICLDFKILSNMKCKGEKPFLLCINKNVIKKNILVEEEKKLAILKKEYEEKNVISNNISETLNKSKIETEIKMGKQNEVNILNKQEINIPTEIKKAKMGKKKVSIYHQGSLNVSSFFKIKEHNNISLNLPNKIKVLINTDNYVNKNDVNITIEKKVLELKFTNEEKNITVNLPYPCNDKDYHCFLKKDKKIIEIYLNLCEDFVKDYANSMYEKYFSNKTEENDSLSYIDDVVKNYEQKKIIKVHEDKENKENEMEKEKNELRIETEKIKTKRDEYKNYSENTNQKFLESENSSVKESKEKLLCLESKEYMPKEKKNKDEKKLVTNNYETKSDNSLNVNYRKGFLNFNIEENLNCSLQEDYIKKKNNKNENINKDASQEKKTLSFSDTLNKHNNVLYNEKKTSNDLNIEVINETNLFNKEQTVNKIISAHSCENKNVKGCCKEQAENDEKLISKNKIDINESEFLCDTNFYKNIDRGVIFSCMLWTTYM